LDQEWLKYLDSCLHQADLQSLDKDCFGATSKSCQATPEGRITEKQQTNKITLENTGVRVSQESFNLRYIFQLDKNKHEIEHGLEKNQFFDKLNIRCYLCLRLPEGLKARGKRIILN
jgi:hypothetical protein